MSNAPILPQVAAGDPRAVEECIARYSGLVWSLARRMVGPEAEDAVQEIFIELWKNAGRYQESIAAEATFVAMVARRRLIDRRRRSERQPLVALETDSADLLATDGDLVEHGAEAALAARAIRQLQDKERQVLWMSVGQGLSHSEIAERTKLPLGTVKTYARRALMRVRDRLRIRKAGQLQEISS